MDITLKKGSILIEDVDCIIIPTNSSGALIGDFLGQVKAVAGEDVEDEAISQAPILIGEAIATKPGFLRTKVIIHAPIAEFAEGKTDEHAVLSALLVALELAEEHNAQRIGLPLHWHLPQKKEAVAVLSVLSMHKGLISEAILADPDAGLVKEWQIHLGRMLSSKDREQDRNKGQKSPKP